MKKFKCIVFGLLSAVLVLASGCASEPERPAASPAATPAASTASAEEAPKSGDLSETLPSPEKTDIAFRLNWKIKGEFAPFYVTKERGIFEKYGLDVEVMEGSGSTPALQAVAQKNDDFAVVSTVEPSQGIGENMPVKMIASYMTNSPLVILSFPDNPVKSPKDLEGKEIAMSPTSTFTKLIDKFMETNEVDASKVTQVHLESSARNSAFLTKQADAIEVFSTNELPMFEQKLGVKLETMFAKDYGYNVAGLTLVAHNDFLAENPNTTKRFLAAIDEGLKYTMENPEEAAKIMKELFPETVDEQLFVDQIHRTAELLDNEAHPFGWMNEESFAATLDILESTALIKARKDLSAYYTNDYLPAR